MGIDNQTMDGFINGAVIIADRCTGGGLTSKMSNIFSLLSAFKNDSWDYDEGSIHQYGPYYLQTTTTDGIDIWEL